MRELAENCFMWDKDTDLVFSPDDNGWYFQRYPDHYGSQLFSKLEDAKEAWRDSLIIWSA